MSKQFVPYVPEKTDMREFTIKAVLLGLVLAVVLGAANAYLGLRAGMTVSASFPAAIIAIAAFRLPFFRGTVLEQNITRTTAAIGEAIAACAIFTVPAFVLVKVGGERLWTEFHYWETSIILLVGSLVGILFVILLRRTLVVDADLPFPEGLACYEIVKSGQSGESGAKFVFGAMGIAALVELFKNSAGIAMLKEQVSVFIKFPASVIHHFTGGQKHLADISHTGSLTFTSPAASPALIGVGYIIGPKYSCINFSGGVLAWFVFVPLAIFFNPQFFQQLSAGGADVSAADMAYTAWVSLVRPVAIGAMLVGAFYTLYGLKGSLVSAIQGIFKKRAGNVELTQSRLEKDLNLKWVFITAMILIIPMTFLFYHYCESVFGAILAAVVMTILSFLFAAVGGWLVGLVGNSNQPVSGLALSALIVAALLMVAIGVKGLPGIAAVLAVTTIVCCVAGLAGDIIQDLKVGQLIGGTPWKMEMAGIIGTILVAFTTVGALILLHNNTPGGIGGEYLSAPQAGLMAQLSAGIVGGDMPWGLVVIGMCFSLALILVKAPAPMLIAVGMYLPFKATFAIFVGGVIKWIADSLIARRGAKPEGEEGMGTLIASGFIAGESITGILLAALYAIMNAGRPEDNKLESLTQWIFGTPELSILNNAGGWLSIIVFAVVAFALIYFPVKKRTA